MYGYHVYIRILYTHIDKNFDFPNKNVGVIHEYGLSLLNPPAPLKWKTEIFSSKIFLIKVLFLKTKASEYYLESNSASRKLIKLSNRGTDCFSQPAHRSRIDVGRSQLWHCSASLHLSGATQTAERR